MRLRCLNHAMNQLIYTHFLADWVALGGTGDVPHCGDVFARLEAGYSEPWRHFHDARHVLALLRKVGQVQSLVEDLPAVRMAVWFHDVILEPGDSDNERASANLWRELATGHLVPSQIDSVDKLILDTRHTVAPHSPDGALLADIDIAGLGADASVFSKQSEMVAAEFPAGRRAQCLSAQHAFMQCLLDRKWVYNTAHFRDRFESRARDNIGQFLAGGHAQAS